MQSVRPCPYCKKPVNWDKSKWRPFCSERCKMIDLGHWAMGSYFVKGEKISKESYDENIQGEDNKPGCA